MEKSQVLKIIKSGESQEVEFKESFHSSQKFSELMCAFANTYVIQKLVEMEIGKECLEN